MCQPNSEVYHFDMRTRNLTSIPSIDTDFSIIALSAAPRRLYLLDSSGNLFLRRGINLEHTPLGQNWDKLDTFQIGSIICSIAASENSLWAIAEDGSIFVAVEGLKIGTSPHWERMLGPKIADKMDQIRTSSTGKYVWVFSKSTGRGFARSAVDETTHWKGNSWIETPSDIKLGNLAIGDNIVWGMERGTSKVYRLRNLSASNIVGIGWRLMPFQLQAISVDASENRLWGLDVNGRLVKHKMDIYPRKCLQTVKPTTYLKCSSSTSSESWMDVESNGYTLCKDIGYL